METIKKVIHITPIASDLLSNVMLKCLDKTCESTFQNYGNLCLHMSKHHKIIINNKDDFVIKQYYCPDINCKYNMDNLNLYTSNKNFFTNIRLLKQHYIKVHAEKSINCEICNKSFYNVTAKCYHEKFCGTIFKCKDCNWKYNTLEALQTHCKRKGHTNDIEKKTNNKLQIKKQEKQRLTEILNKKTKYIKIVPNLTESNNKNITIPPKMSQQMVTMSDDNKILNNKKWYSKKVKTKTKITQTNLKSTQLNNSLDIKNISTDIVRKYNNVTLQPAKEEIPSTDTIIGFNNSSAINSTNTCYVNNSNKRKQLENFDIFDSESNSNNNNLTKNLNNLNYMEDDSINNYFRFNSDTFTNGLCHIETQTDSDPFDTSNQMFFYSQHTQTCDEILSELGFSDIQTQTTETQTNFSCTSNEKYMTYNNNNNNYHSTYTQTY